MKTIFVSLTGKTNSSAFSDYNISEWLYFSPNYLNFQLLKESSPSTAKYNDIGESLQKKAMELKNSYIEVIGCLGTKYSKKYPLAWWTSRVAERNEMTTHAFLTVCYYNIFSDMYENEKFQNSSLIIVESPSLYHLIVNQLRKRYKVVTLGKPYFITWPFFRQKIAAVYRIMKFASWVFSGKFQQIPDLYFASDSKKTFIRTWVSDKTISADGALHDAYFPGLCEYLEKEGYEVVIIPNFYNLTFSSKEIQTRINKCKYQFFIPENYLIWRDYFKILVILIYQVLISRLDNVVHKGKDISKILTETQKAGIFFSYTYIAQMFALKNLSKADCKIKSFIYTYENMLPEKPFSYAIKEYFPEVKSIGFQHSVLYPLQTCLYPSSQEWKDMPLPDKIICSGVFFLDILIKHGALPERLVLGPALRFKNLISKSEKERGEIVPTAFHKNRILIAFPLANPDAVELAIKSSEAIKLMVDIGGLKIGLKPHPMMPVDELTVIKSFYNYTNCNVEIVDKPMGDVLSQYSLLITMASGVVFDGMIEGLPVIRVGRSNSLNFDPADFIESNPYDFRAQTVEGLNELICKLLLLDDEERMGILDYGRQFVRESFTPVSENTLQAFISTN
ncbi:MAG: hypothetical protein GY777_24145 [Candidatus Brocadiaceae bacterium]|nr:hypothetical protein [Candidatus Brocadiaceae bacterium]